MVDNSHLNSKYALLQVELKGEQVVDNLVDKWWITGG